MQLRAGEQTDEQLRTRTDCLRVVVLDYAPAARACSVCALAKGNSGLVAMAPGQRGP